MASALALPFTTLHTVLTDPTPEECQLDRAQWKEFLEIKQDTGVILSKFILSSIVNMIVLYTNVNT